MSDLFGLMRENPFGTFLVVISVLWTAERIVRTIVNRNKPVQCDCDTDDDYDDYDDGEDEIVARGGEEEDS